MFKFAVRLLDTEVLDHTVSNNSSSIKNNVMEPGGVQDHRDPVSIIKLNVMERGGVQDHRDSVSIRLFLICLFEFCMV